MLTEFQAMSDGHLGQKNVEKHWTELLEDKSKPVYSTFFRAWPKTRKFGKVEINRMQTKIVIKQSQTEWAAPIVFAAKKDGTPCFWVDYRRLNAIMKRDSYLILIMNKSIDSLGKAPVFSTLNANSGYWKVEIDRSDRDKIANSSQYGLYRFTRMPY